MALKIVDDKFFSENDGSAHSETPGELQAEAGVDNRGGPPHDGGGGGMSENYITHHEFQKAIAGVNERFAKIETRLDLTATKADIAEAKFVVATWTVGTAIAMTAIIISVITIVLNSAIPNQPPAPTSPPIIINVPPSPTALPATPGTEQKPKR